MKPFNLEEAKAGKPVCTRDGRSARIVEWNYNPNGICHILAVTQSRLGGTGEAVHSFTDTGELTPATTTNLDLFMAPAQHTVWVNLYHGYAGVVTGCNATYSSEDEARDAVKPGIASDKYIGTFPLTYEE